MPERTIVLLRHAKAENPDGIADADRPLTARGHADAAAAGAWLAHSGHLPDLVICSPAKRTRQTWHGVALALAEAVTSAENPAESSIASATDPDIARATGSSPVVRYEDKVYSGSAEDLLTLVRDADESVSAILVVGHNPAISQLSALLDAALTPDSDGLRTSSLAVHRLNGSWRECGPGAASLLASHTARAPG
ncbi:phosphohistidine phosphatase [Micromonospora pattaloongensis]|uniref:Phosphohistidine phosphatase n=1 Tax=Micromonospora pattaloongensis TaxID=405436 RepID=A0A1H3I2B4_9ACTN|nr:histidine phosphatase family protein [Micromonospora pattaloongensis]SDY21841.1 phosphohistidine phosphatase [Micromonospora pattaloongensis]